METHICIRVWVSIRLKETPIGRYLRLPFVTRLSVCGVLALRLSFNGPQEHPIYYSSDHEANFFGTSHMHMTSSYTE